jgi:hypothetical protein
MAPEDTVQAFADPWWEDVQGTVLERGRLLKTLVPFVGQTPYILDPSGRAEDPSDHSRARITIEPYRLGMGSKSKTLPVAALPEWKGQRFVFSRGRVRPAVVISTAGHDLPQELRVGMAPYQTAPTILVAPYFGADQDGTRAGYPPEILGRIRHAEYPRFMWDSLPLGDVRESVLRLDQIFPMGTDASGYELKPHRLSRDALLILDEWLCWLLSGAETPREGSILADIRNGLSQ